MRILRPFDRWWTSYKQFVEGAMLTAEPSGASSITYWREKFFTRCILYALPASFIALIPSVAITYLHGHLLIPVFDIVALLSITSVSLNRQFSIFFRKAFVVVMFYLLSIIVTCTLGAFGIGSIYLLALSVFIALLFPTRITYGSVVLNIFIYTVYAFIIYFKLFNSPLVRNYSISYWIGYSLNFLFLNIVVVVQIRQVISGLEGAVMKETRLLGELQAEVAEKNLRNGLLKESEEHYKSLFFLNPSAMWIFDADTLKFLQVNDAAIRKYGYTEQEFMQMTIKEIRKEEEVTELMHLLKDTLQNRMASVAVVRHCTKDGHIFYAEVRCSTIPFRGKEARLVIARNITSQIEYTQAIERQNAKLREIAYMQSHIVRAPVARIMALADLITQDANEKPDEQLMSYLDTSVKELDAVIKDIVNSSTEESFSITQAEDFAE